MLFADDKSEIEFYFFALVLFIVDFAGKAGYVKLLREFNCYNVTT